MSKDSINKRYAYKLSTNLLTFIINIVTAGIVPRALGVASYGIFNYVTTQLTQVINLLDLRTSACFFTKLSQRHEDNNLIVYYAWYSIFISIITLIFSVIVALTPLCTFVFSTTSITIVTFSALYVVLKWFLDRFIGVMDAIGSTVALERMRIINKVVSTVLLLILFAIGYLNLTVYFLYSFLITILLIGAILLHLKKTTAYRFSLKRLPEKAMVKQYNAEFWKYSKPLGVYVIISFLTITYDRWILQHYGGDHEQGLYSFAFALSGFALLFVTSIVPLFTRELSISANEGNFDEMGRLFRKYVPTLYALTAYFSCFFFVESAELIRLFGGKDYTQSNLSFSILTFYPLVSTYSNLNGSVIYATGKTNILLQVARILTPLGMIITFVFINNNGWGLNMGAIGLSIKTLAIEFISVVVILILNCRMLKMNFWNFFSHMLYSLIPFMVFAYAAKWLISFINLDLIAQLLPAYLAKSGQILVQVSLTGVLYTLGNALLILVSPGIFGLSKTAVQTLLIKLKQLSIH